MRAEERMTRKLHVPRPDEAAGVAFGRMLDWGFPSSFPGSL